MKLIAIYICWLDGTDCLLSLVLSDVEIVVMYFVIRFHITFYIINHMRVVLKGFVMLIKLNNRSRNLIIIVEEYEHHNTLYVLHILCTQESPEIFVFMKYISSFENSHSPSQQISYSQKKVHISTQYCIAAVIKLLIEVQKYYQQ